MRKTLALLASPLLCLNLPLAAQVSISFHMGKQDIPVVGLPFSADETVRVHRFLANGMPVTQEVKGRVFRSAEGLERYEATFPSTDAAQPEPNTLIYILDHTKHTAIVLNTRLKTATRQDIPPNASTEVKIMALSVGNPAERNIKEEKPTVSRLGHETFEFLDIEGLLATSTIPAGKLGIDQPLPVTLEEWVAPKLKLVVRQIEKNPVGGERTAQLSNIRAEEPDPSLFQVPADYTSKEQPSLGTALPAFLKGAPRAAPSSK